VDGQVEVEERPKKKYNNEHI
jgi:protein required for attachment to host cells